MAGKRYTAEGTAIHDTETGNFTRALTPEGASIIVGMLNDGTLDPATLNWRKL